MVSRLTETPCSRLAGDVLAMVVRAAPARRKNCPRPVGMILTRKRLLWSRGVVGLDCQSIGAVMEPALCSVSWLPSLGHDSRSGPPGDEEIERRVEGVCASVEG